MVSRFFYRPFNFKLPAVLGDDPYAKPKQAIAFEDELRKAGVDWHLVSYADAVHAFTNPESGTDKSKGVAYNEKANKRSGEAMKSFFSEIFK